LSSLVLFGLVVSQILKQAFVKIPRSSDLHNHLKIGKVDITCLTWYRCKEQTILSRNIRVKFHKKLLYTVLFGVTMETTCPNSR